MCFTPTVDENISGGIREPKEYTSRTAPKMNLSFDLLGFDRVFDFHHKNRLRSTTRSFAAETGANTSRMAEEVLNSTLDLRLQM